MDGEELLCIHGDDKFMLRVAEMTHFRGKLTGFSLCLGDQNAARVILLDNKIFINGGYRDVQRFSHW